MHNLIVLSYFGMTLDIHRNKKAPAHKGLRPYLCIEKTIIPTRLSHMVLATCRSIRGLHQEPH